MGYTAGQAAFELAILAGCLLIAGISAYFWSTNSDSSFGVSGYWD